MASRVKGRVRTLLEEEILDRLGIAHERNPATGADEKLMPLVREMADDFMGKHKTQLKGAIEKRREQLQQPEEPASDVPEPGRLLDKKDKDAGHASINSKPTEASLGSLRGRDAGTDALSMELHPVLSWILVMLQGVS